MNECCDAGAGFGAALRSRGGLGENLTAPRATYAIECVDGRGRVRWRDRFANLVVTAGKNDLLMQYFKGTAYSASWYVGLIDDAGFSAISPGDSMTSHAGWAEAIAYSNANRPALTLGAASGGSISNAGAVATFDINAAATLRGAFVANSNVKGGGAGTLYSAGAFAAVRTVAGGDTLNVTVTLSVA